MGREAVRTDAQLGDGGGDQQHYQQDADRRRGPGGYVSAGRHGGRRPRQRVQVPLATCAGAPALGRVARAVYPRAGAHTHAARSTHVDEGGLEDAGRGGGRC